MKIAAVVLLLVAFFSLSHALRFERVHIVDYAKIGSLTNLLFRGDVPVNHTTMAYPTLMSMLGVRANEVGLSLGNNPYLIDLSLMNFIDENKAETDFWKDPANNDKGEFLNWPLGLAGLVHPESYTEEERRKMANSTDVWSFDQLPDRIPELIKLLNTPGPIDPATGSPRPVLIYIHCAAGCDRTGEIIAAYRMYHINKASPHAVTDLYERNIKECGRPQNWYGTGGLEWYCLYFSYLNNLDVGNCIHLADCEFGHGCSWPPVNPPSK